MGEENSYTGSPGEEWWHEVDSVNRESGLKRYIILGTGDVIDGLEYQDEEVGDEYEYEDKLYKITNINHVQTIGQMALNYYIFELDLIMEVTIYNVYKYEFMNWVFIRSEER